MRIEVTLVSQAGSCRTAEDYMMTAHEYAVRYPDSLVRDDSWRCVADVIASYAGGYYTDSRGQVTGTLVRTVVGSDVWVEVE